MKQVFLVLVQLLVFTLAWAQHEGHELPKKETDTSGSVYTCPMHPEVQSDKPGTCPKCGMDLVKKNMKPATPVHGNEQAPATAWKLDMKPGKTVRYDLYITDTMVNFTGRLRHAYAINGQIPGPELVFTEGDTAEIYLHNMLKNEETSLHWHGVILPNQFDGVPYLTTAPVHPGEVHLYKFAVVQNGTYWYHSHSGLQEQAGIYGALIFRPREEQKDTVHASADDHAMHQPAAADTVAQQENEHAGHNMNHGAGHMQAATARAGNGSYHAEHTVVLSEWTDEDPQQVQRRLRTVNDWYAIKKGSTQSYSEAIRAGHFKTKLINEWKRMNAMDVSDVYYDRFMVNGLPESTAPHFRKGDRVRLRIVNAGASSYFWVQFAGGKMTVIANDGNDVMPVEVDRLIIGVSETYDVVVNIPENNAYELRVTPEDRTSAASLWLGSGPKVEAFKLPRLRYFEGMKMMNSMMKMNGDMNPMDMEMSMQQMDMNMVMYDEFRAAGASNHTEADTAALPETDHMRHMQGAAPPSSEALVTLNYAMLRSPHQTLLPDAPVKELFFTLTGNMNRYVWSINGKIVSEWDKILVEKGHNVRIVMFNNSMMRHPMHLHGHDFRVINGQGAYAPFKNVLDIMPMETDTIEFAGSQDGDWFFHCHILYHMMAGMGNVFSYNNSLPNPDLPDKVAAYNKFIRHHQMFHLMAEIGLESNGSDGQLMLSGERFELRTEWRIGLKRMHGNEVEAYFGRYLGKMQWWYPFVGFDFHRNTTDNETEKNLFGQPSNQNNRKALVAGVEYVLPMLFRAQFRFDSKGKFRFQLGREDIPLTPRLRLNLLANTDREYMGGFRYIVRKWLAISTHYYSDMGFGAGVTIIY